MPNPITHGLSTRREYQTWENMIARCYRPDHASYKYYGGDPERPVWVCDRWRESVLAFYEDMGACPDGCQINRKNNEGPYSPENCEWATKAANQRNKRSNLWVLYRGVKRLMIELAEEKGINYHTLYSRIYAYEWEVDEAVDTPVATKHRRRAA